MFHVKQLKKIKKGVLKMGDTMYFDFVKRYKKALNSSDMQALQDLQSELFDLQESGSGAENYQRLNILIGTVNRAIHYLCLKQKLYVRS